MPPAEMQRLFGITMEAATKPGSPIFHQKERVKHLKVANLDDGTEMPARNWESLWIDMGGEG